MSAVSIWILSITGVVIMSVVVDLVMPNGTTSKFIKNIFAFVIIIVILAPIVSFLSNKDIILDDFFKQSSSVIVQEDFISSVNRQLIDQMQQDIEKTLKANGIKQVQVGISADIFNSDLEIEKVSVDLTQIVIDEDFSHIDIKTSIKKIILKFVKVEENKIFFYE